VWFWVCVAKRETEIRRRATATQPTERRGQEPALGVGGARRGPYTRNQGTVGVPRAREGCKCGPLREAVREQPGTVARSLKRGHGYWLRWQLLGPLREQGIAGADARDRRGATERGAAGVRCQSREEGRSG
jgi:hypothetical protein